MKDRISLYPGRVKLNPVAGEANTYDMVRADQPTQEGTALNKANLLSDETAAALGLAGDPTVNDALKSIHSEMKDFMKFRYEEITESGVWVAPDNIVGGKITVLCCGGGGAGGGNSNKPNTKGIGGKGGKYGGNGGDGRELNSLAKDGEPGTKLTVKPILEMVKGESFQLSGSGGPAQGGSSGGGGGGYGGAGGRGYNRGGGGGGGYGSSGGNLDDYSYGGSGGGGYCRVGLTSTKGGGGGGGYGSNNRGGGGNGKNDAAGTNGSDGIIAIWYYEE